VLTGGGDCPGLNAVIRAVARRSCSRGHEVIGVRVGEEDGVKARERVELDAGRRDARKNLAEAGVEVRIGEQPFAAHLDEQRRVADVRHAHGRLVIAEA